MSRTAIARYLALSVLLAAPLPACRRTAEPPQTGAAPRVQRRHMVTLSRNYRGNTLAISDDGNDYAFVSSTVAGQTVVHNGTAGPLFIECSRPQFAPQSTKLFYWGIEGGAAQPALTLMAGGQKIATDMARPGILVFDKSGSRWAVVSGTPAQGEGEQAQRGPVVMLVDGREMGRYPDASRPDFSSDAKHVAYLIEDAAGRIKLVVDGSERTTFDTPVARTSPVLKRDPIGPNLQQYRVAYLADGSLMVVAQDRDGWAIYRNDARLGSYPLNVLTRDRSISFSFGDEYKATAAIVPASLATATSAPVAAWWERQAGTEERWRVVRNGHPDGVACPRYWEADPPLLSADGTRCAYHCPVNPEGQGSDDVFLVVGGTQYGPYVTVWGPAFSDDGKRIVYAAADSLQGRSWSYYVDGKAQPLKYDSVWRPRFDATGTQTAWEAQRGTRSVLCMNGNSVGSFDDVLWGPKFSASGELSWVIRRGRRIIRVDVRGQ